MCQVFLRNLPLLMLEPVSVDGWCERVNSSSDVRVLYYVWPRSRLRVCGWGLMSS